MKSLPIEMRHALHISTLPIHHQDPFDRILIAQAQMEELPILSADPQFGKYDVTIIW
jgi:PIN domain nuclease of toxin-antitoxin system